MTDANVVNCRTREEIADVKKRLRNVFGDWRLPDHDDRHQCVCHAVTFVQGDFVIILPRILNVNSTCATVNRNDRQRSVLVVDHILLFFIHQRLYYKTIGGDVFQVPYVR